MPGRSTPAPAAVIIRAEAPGDEQAIHDVTEAAFATLDISDGSEPAVIDALRQIAIAHDVPAAERSVLKLHQAFLDSIRLWGRLHELTMLLQHKLTSRDLLSNLDMGLDMFVKGKIHPLPQRIKGMEEVKALFEMKDEG